MYCHSSYSKCCEVADPEDLQMWRVVPRGSGDQQWNKVFYLRSSCQNESANGPLQDQLPTGCSVDLAVALILLWIIGFDIRQGIKHRNWADLGTLVLHIIIQVTKHVSEQELRTMLVMQVCLLIADPMTPLHFACQLACRSVCPPFSCNKALLLYTAAELQARSWKLETLLI